MLRMMFESEGDQGDDDGSLGVARGIKGGNDEFDASEGRQTGSVVEQGASGEASGFRDELAVLEEHADDGFAKDHQAEGGRDGDVSDDANGKGEGALQALVIVGSSLMGHHRKNGGGYGDGIAAEHEFHDTVGDVEGGEAAARHAGCGGEEGVHEEIDLGNAHAEKAREHQARHAADARDGKKKYQNRNACRGGRVEAPG